MNLSGLGMGAGMFGLCRCPCCKMWFGTMEVQGWNATSFTVKNVVKVDLALLEAHSLLFRHWCREAQKAVEGSCVALHEYRRVL